MADSIIQNPNYLLNTADQATMQLITQSGWTIGYTVIFRNSKPTVTSGSIPGVRSMTAEEVNAFNSNLGWNSKSHMLTMYTTNSYIAEMSGRIVMLIFS